MLDERILVRDRRITFGDGLLWKSDGVAHCTIRRPDPKRADSAEYFRYCKGDRVAARFFDGEEMYWFLLEIVDDTVFKPNEEITDEEAQAAGFVDANDIFNNPNGQWYENLQPTDGAASIWFRALEDDELTNEELELLEEKMEAS